MKYPILARIIPPFVKLWLRDVKGLEHIPKQGGFILASNHASYFDHFAIMSILIPYLNRDIYFLAKKEHFKSTHEKVWHSHFKAIPVDREKGTEALNKAIAHLQKGNIIAIYPEGTRTVTGSLNRGKTGVARLALGANVPVIPIGLQGTFNILPKGKYLPRLGKASMTVGKPLFFARYEKEKITKKLLRDITDTIMNKIGTLAKKKYKWK